MRKYEPELAEQLPAMFSQGEAVEEICVTLGIDQATFDAWKAQYPDFNHAAEMGELRAECFYEDLLLQSVRGELNHKDLTDESLIELMQNRFETYRN